MLVALANVPTHVHAQATESALIVSMEQRLPALMELKLAGKVGETNLALIESRASLERDQRRLIANENRDRLAQYRLIAARLGVSVATVQQKRAEQIRENSPRGIWIQSKSGDWYRD
jgi:uncharacterized protein YdbL (DUF1318 family)